MASRGAGAVGAPALPTTTTDASTLLPATTDAVTARSDRVGAGSCRTLAASAAPLDGLPRRAASPSAAAAARTAGPDSSAASTAAAEPPAAAAAATRGPSLA